MKTKRLFPLTLFLLSLIILSSGCNPLKNLHEDYPKVKVSTKPDVMEVHADSLEIEILGKIPEEYMEKKGVIKYNPTIIHKSGDTTLAPFFIKGEDAKIKEESVDPIATIPYKDGGTFKHTIKLPYKPDYKKAELKTLVNFKIESKYDTLDKCTGRDPDSLTEGTITTSLTVKPLEDVLIAGVEPSKGQQKFKPGERPGDLEGSKDDIFAPDNHTRKPLDGVVRPESVNQEGTIFFEINRSKVRESEKKGEEMQGIRNFAKNENLVINGVVINSYASPDGELELNANLTKERANSTYEYLKKDLKSLGHQSIHDSDFYKKASTEEDWSGFQKLVQESDLEEKNEILNIANSNMALDEKESAIRKMDVWEPYMVDTLLPKLRRSEINVQGFLRIRPLDSIRDIASNQKLDSLHRKELIKLAYESNSLSRKREIYNHYTKRYPQDWIGYNNLYALLLFEGQYKEAKKAFQKLDKRFPNNAYIQNNLGVANRHIRLYDTARMNYKFAKTQGKNESNNLGILDIKVAKYESSVKTFEDNRCDYNVALAYTLKEDYDKALEKIECITNKTADVYYLKAIVGARQGNIELMTTSLRRAVKKNGKIRERAKNDLEFRKYHGTPEFKNALRY